MFAHHHTTRRKYAVTNYLKQLRVKDVEIADAVLTKCTPALKYLQIDIQLDRLN